MRSASSGLSCGASVVDRRPVAEDYGSRSPGTTGARQDRGVSAARRRRGRRGRSLIRELDRRGDDGLDVRLLRSELDRRVAVVVHDPRTDDAFCVPVLPHDLAAPLAA
jgi:hypothetical protein